MDPKAMMDGEGWTEELHTSFLTWMEETFVRQMLTCAATATADPPLDRQLPDSATESNHRFSRSPTPPKAERGNEDEVRRRPLSLCDVPRDQVVPKLGSNEEKININQELGGFQELLRQPKKKRRKLKKR